MGYGSESKMGGLVPDAASLAAIALQTPADKSTWSVLEPATVLRVSCLVLTAITVADAIVAVDRRVLAGSDTGRVEIGRLTIPSGTVAGKVVWKDLPATDLDMGDQLVLELIQASTAGGGILSIITIPRSETPMNQADAIKSA